MPKNLMIDPNELRKPGYAEFKSVPMNQYQKTVKDEIKNYSKQDLIDIYRDMRVIREFETLMNSIKKTGNYNGVEYNHPGPAHLGMGQEAACVGQAYALDVNDYIFGSHRSHGEILAKGYAAIKKLDDAKLMEIMENYFDGRILGVCEKYADSKGNTKKLGENFLLYGTLAEIFAREIGFNKGLGGSMHAFFCPFGIYPNNAIVGGSAGIATGAALYKKVNKVNGIVVANIGDASIGCGPVYEAMNFASMDQLKQLWPDDYKGGLPILFNVMNNSYGMGGQTIGETMAYDVLARLGAGVNPDQMHAERIDGFNPLAVIEATKRKKALLEDKKGPVLLDVITYRFSGHSASDASLYRAKEEIEMWEEQDPIKSYSKQLISNKLLGKSDIEKIDNDIVENLTEMLKLSINPEISSIMDMKKDANQIGKLMFSNMNMPSMSDAEPEVLCKKSENSRVKQIAKKERFGIKDGKVVSKNRVFQIRDALFEAIIDKYYTDPTLVCYGEDVRDWGGAYAVTRALPESVGYQRLFNAPISEAAIVATGVGYACAGGRSLVEIMYCDFIGRAGDEIFNQMAKWQAMSAGVIKMPMVMRVSVGSKYGAQHSQDWTSLVAHIPGLKAVFPTTPYDAKGLLNSALSGTDPVIVFESQRLYDMGELFHEGGVPKEYYEVPIGEPDVKRVGSDITILTIGATLYRAIEAADILKEKYNISAEIIDARSIVPFNYDKVLESVRKTGKIVLASDACERNSYLKDMANNICEMAFDDLDAPPVVVGAENWITPAYELEEYFFPQAAWILDAINEKILPLPGHQPIKNYTEVEKRRTSKEGI